MVTGTPCTNDQRLTQVPGPPPLPIPSSSDLYAPSPSSCCPPPSSTHAPIHTATSGLDAAVAQDVVTALASYSGRGMNVVCVIHQPRHTIFDLFDSVMLLAGGRLVYHGPQFLTVRPKEGWAVGDRDRGAWARGWCRGWGGREVEASTGLFLQEVCSGDEQTKGTEGRGGCLDNRSSLTVSVGAAVAAAA
jgi:hypothetical protein